MKAGDAGLNVAPTFPTINNCICHFPTATIQNKLPPLSVYRLPGTERDNLAVSKYKWQNVFVFQLLQWSCSIANNKKLHYVSVWTGRNLIKLYSLQLTCYSRHVGRRLSRCGAGWARLEHNHPDLCRSDSGPGASVAPWPSTVALAPKTPSRYLVRRSRKDERECDKEWRTHVECPDDKKKDSNSVFIIPKNQFMKPVLHLLNLLLVTVVLAAKAKKRNS